MNAGIRVLTDLSKDCSNMPVSQDDDAFDKLVARAKLRISYVAGGMNEGHGESLLRRIQLGPRLSVYSHLYSITDSSLIDVESDQIPLEQIFEEFMNTSSIVAEFEVANGTNVQLLQGESVVCCGDQELVAMKLSQDELVTYRPKEQCFLLLEQVVSRLDGLVHESWSREINFIHQRAELLGEA